MFEELLEKLKNDILLFLENAVKRFSPKDRGNLVNSWFIDTTRAKLFNTAKYSVFQNYGTKAIRGLPKKPIMEWARRKGIRNWFGVWAKIRARGITPKRFVEKAIAVFIRHKDEILKQSIEDWRRKLKK